MPTPTGTRALALRCRPCTAASRPSYLRVVHSAPGRVVWSDGAEPGVYGGTGGVEAACPRCETVYRRARRPKRVTACAPCCRRHARGQFDDRFHLRFR